MAKGRYNVILIICDTLRKDHVGAYGGVARTPNMDRLAREGVMYTNAYPESLPTIPVRRAIFTGYRVFPFREHRYRRGSPFITIFGWQPIPDEQNTIAEVFKAAGYRTALITDNYHLFEPGMNFTRAFDEWIFIRGQEWDNYRSANLVSDEEVARHLTPKMRGTVVEALLRRYLSNVSERRWEEDWFPARVFREAVRWLEQNRDAERFLLVIDSFDPHEPWDPPHEFVEMYDPGYSGVEVITPLYGPADYLSDRELRHMKAHYAGEVTLVDKWLGFFLDKVYELGLDRSTIIALVSDHGHQLGEHGITGKVAWGLYPELVDVPLIIRHPEGVGAGERVDAYVYDHDLFPTLVEMAGVGLGYRVDGINIWRYVEDEGFEYRRGYVTSAFANYLMYRDEEYWLITNREGGEPQLYDLRSDPGLRRNIASEAPDIVKELYRRIVEDAGGSIPRIEVPREVAYQWYTQLYVVYGGGEK